MATQEQFDLEIAKLIEWGFVNEIECPDFKPYHEDEKVFYHKSETRQNIVVVLLEGQDDDVDYNVFVREDIGCGYVNMPFGWSQLDYKWLNALKMSLDGEGLKGEKLF